MNNSDDNKRLTSTALRLSRKQQLEFMVSKRKSNFEYLRKVHSGNVFWLNCILFSKDFMKKYSKSVPFERIIGFYNLGLGVANVLKLEPGAPLVKGISQLMEEYEYFNSSSAMQSVKYVIARSSSTPYDHVVNTENENGESSTSKIYKFNGEIVYQYFSTANLPFIPCYLEVVSTLSILLSELYDLFLQEDCFSNSYLFENIVKLDARLKTHFISLAAKELNEMAINNTISDLASLRDGMSSFY